MSESERRGRREKLKAQAAAMPDIGAAPKTRREKELMTVIGPAYGAALQSGIPILIAQLDDELAARDTGREPEPDLRVPKPDGPLAGIQPLVMVD